MVFNKSIISDKLGNDLRISSVNTFESAVNFHNFSAKFVLAGDELYQFRKKSQKVAPGEFIIGNDTTSANVIINSIKPVKGICVDIAKETINDVIDASFIKQGDFKKFIFEQAWTNNKFNTSTTHLGHAFNMLGNKYAKLKSGEETLNEDIFYSLAECVVKDQELNFKQFQSLNKVKEETNVRLFNFIHDSKNFIDQHYLQKIQLEDIANEAKLSQYHYIRLFRRVFNITPHQYIIEKRLQMATKLLKEGESILDVTYQTGFSSPSHFCKTFKKQYGTPPKNFAAQKLAIFDNFGSNKTYKFVEEFI